MVMMTHEEEEMKKEEEMGPMKKALRKRSLEVLGTNTDPGPGVFTMNPSEPVESGPSELEFLVALKDITMKIQEDYRTPNRLDQKKKVLSAIMPEKILQS
ncbi:hypothetical protein U0070_006529 [Myodes glareolus]|uniref:BESS domain-containing protein n=1 Tax=Myodes glareolus TaxID=447135 RepID=A0AAW0JQ29_MYOGA